MSAFPRNLGPSACGLVLALTSSACSGGGAAPNGAPLATPVAQPAQSAAPAAAVQFVVRIPLAGAAAQRRHPAYVSSGTKSIVAGATAAAGASATSTVNVGSPSCTTSATSIVCTIGLQAPVGDDTFVVSTYAGTNGTGALLSTGTIAQTISGTGANVVPIVLDGVVASLALQIANAYLPVIDGGSTTATVSAKDASGETIVGTYETPIALSAPAGLTLSATTIATSAQTALTIAYDGISRTALQIAATSGAATARGAIVPTTHYHVYTSPASIPGGAVEFPILRGPDGALYYGDIGPYTVYPNDLFLGPTAHGVIERVDPATGALTSVGLAGIDPTGLLFVGNDLYFTEAISGKLGRILGAGSGGFSAANYSELTLPNANPNPGTSAPNGFAFPRRLVDVGGTLYVSSALDASIEEVPIASWATGTSAVTRLVANQYDRPDGIAEGSDGNVYVADYTANFSGSYLLQIAPGSTTINHISDPLITDLGVQPRFIDRGPDGKLYLTITLDPPNPDAVETYDDGFASLALPAPIVEQQPDEVHVGSGTTVDYIDIANNSMVVYDTAAKTYREFPETIAQSAVPPEVQDVADGMDQSYWYTLADRFLGQLPTEEVGHLVLAQGWQLLPEGTLTIDGLGTTGAILLGVAQSTAAPVAVSLTTTTPGICSVTAPAGYVDSYVLEGLAAGTCVITARDASGRTVTRSVPVSSSTLTINAHRRIRNALP